MQLYQKDLGTEQMYEHLEETERRSPETCNRQLYSSCQQKVKTSTTAIDPSVCVFLKGLDQHVLTENRWHGFLHS